MKFIIIALLFVFNSYSQVNHYSIKKKDICLIDFDKNKLSKCFNHVKIDSNYFLDVKKIEKVQIMKRCKLQIKDTINSAEDLKSFKIIIYYINEETAIKETIRILNAFKKPEFIYENQLFTFFKPCLYFSRIGKKIEIYRYNSGVFNEKKLLLDFKYNKLKFDEVYYIGHNGYYRIYPPANRSIIK